MTSDEAIAAANTIADYLRANDIEFEQTAPDNLTAVLPGEHRLRTTVSMVVGRQAVSINAFVVRNPDERHLAIYRWLLERNQRIYGVSYAIDHLGDVYLVGAIPLHAVTQSEIDRVLGSILENSDGAFDHLLSIGFETAIRREWKWRISRGESTRNLAAFEHLSQPKPEA